MNTRDADQLQEPVCCEWIGFTRSETVGASLLAMDVNDNAGCLNERGGWAFFASRARSYRDRRSLLLYIFQVAIVGTPPAPNRTSQLDRGACEKGSAIKGGRKVGDPRSGKPPSVGYNQWGESPGSSP